VLTRAVGGLPVAVAAAHAVRVDALDDRFAAQVDDHGAHARGGHP